MSESNVEIVPAAEVVPATEVRPPPVDPSALFVLASGRVEPGRRERLRTVFTVARSLWAAAQTRQPQMADFYDDPEVAVEVVALIDHYDRTRQWSPFVAPDDRRLQSMLCEIADALLGPAMTIPSGRVEAAPRAPAGWGSARAAPRHSDLEVEVAARMGFAAAHAQAVDGKTPWSRLAQTTQAGYLRDAYTVLSLAKVHGVDAIRLAVLEHSLDPRFAGPIVADVCFGGATRRT